VLRLQPVLELFGDRASRKGRGLALRPVENLRLDNALAIRYIDDCETADRDSTTKFDFDIDRGEWRSLRHLSTRNTDAP
jgi:hypothetical protein